MPTKEPLFATAARRLGVLRGLEATGRDAYTYGPFLQKEEKATGTVSPFRGNEDQPSALAQHHRTMADYYEKKAGSDTIPHTARLDESEKTSLGDEIDMSR